MNNQDFNAYKGQFTTTIRQVLSNAEPGSLDEAAFPAYSHPNPVINHLFWKRLHTVINYIETCQPCQLVLDFGCGSGVMLPFLSQVSEGVIAVDVDLAPLKKVGEHIDFSDNITAYDARDPHNQKFPAASFDLVIALDVLEHVEDLDQTLSHLVGLLKPGGQVIVSGPTENILYQIGRRLAGPEYSGDYHERTIADIRDAFGPLGTVQHLATLYPLLPLFEIFTVTNLIVDENLTLKDAKKIVQGFGSAYFYDTYPGKSTVEILELIKEHCASSKVFEDSPWVMREKGLATLLLKSNNQELDIMLKHFDQFPDNAGDGRKFFQKLYTILQQGNAQNKGK